jgi:hypothetical protein
MLVELNRDHGKAAPTGSDAIGGAGGSRGG